MWVQRHTCFVLVLLFCRLGSTTAKHTHFEKTTSHGSLCPLDRMEEATTLIENAITCANTKECLAVDGAQQGGRKFGHCKAESEGQGESAGVFRRQAIKECRQIDTNGIELDRSCFSHGPTDLGFEDAQAYCQQLGGKLAEPSSLQTLRTLKEKIDAGYFSKAMWIGIMNPIGEEFTFNSTGDQVPYDVLSQCFRTEPNEEFHKGLVLCKLGIYDINLSDLRKPFCQTAGVAWYTGLE